ncbi:MAG: hypothetical protein A3D10_08655 [Omnitrophica WOR_2 bacterium RIFCSPHIGHO2_02_FULL_48_11]|nr:MAG: hypothetical protein A3D10_08655 [Omnitrophica WOR_2 bacterium RIFCSPHIGHO2_02_FULL_48_11]
MGREEILRLQTVDLSKYEDIDLDRLAIYAISQLEKIGAELSFENAVMASFKLFPQKFSLLGFPDYPDANRVMKCLWRLTSKVKPWLSGKIKQGFVVTERGRAHIKEVEDILRGQYQVVKKSPSKTRREELLLKEAMSSTAYLKYIEKQNDSISEGDLCDMLQGTLNSDRKMLKENFFLLQKYAHELKQRNLLDFFNWLEQRFTQFLDIGTE